MKDEMLNRINTQPVIYAARRYAVGMVYVAIAIAT